jgi:tetratricopeptide (TPR) repeat protein
MSRDKWLQMVEPVLSPGSSVQIADPCTAIDQAEEFASLRFGAGDERTIITRLVKAVVYGERERWKLASKSFCMVRDDADFLTDEQSQARLSLAGTLGMFFCSSAEGNDTDQELLRNAQNRCRHLVHDDQTGFGEASLGFAYMRLGLGDLAGAIEELKYFVDNARAEIPSTTRAVLGLLYYTMNEAERASEQLAYCADALTQAENALEPIEMAALFAYAQQLVASGDFDTARKFFDFGQALLDDYYSRFHSLSVQSRLRYSQLVGSSITQNSVLEEILDEGDESEHPLEKLLSATLLAESYDQAKDENHVLQTIARSQTLRRQLIGQYESNEQIDSALSGLRNYVLDGEHPVVTNALVALANQSPMAYLDQVVRVQLQKFRGIG